MFKMGWKLRSGLWSLSHIHNLGCTFQWGYSPHAHTRWLLEVFMFTRVWTLSRIRRTWPLCLTKPGKPSSAG